MSNEKKSSDAAVNVPSIRLFRWISVAYLTIVIFLGWWNGYVNLSGQLADLDELGSILGGVFSPLAFLWLIYASLSQRAELEMQRNELTQNTEYQAKQFSAMELQANTLIKQTRYVRDQSRVLVGNHYSHQQEIKVWKQWFRNSLFELHHEAIDKTGQIKNTAIVPMSPENAELLFRGTILNGALAIETSLPRVHQLSPDQSAEVLKVLASLKSYGRKVDNFCFAAKNKGLADEDLIDKFCAWLNGIAVEAWHAAAHIPVEPPTLAQKPLQTSGTDGVDSALEE